MSKAKKPESPFITDDEVMTSPINNPSFDGPLLGEDDLTIDPVFTQPASASDQYIPQPNAPIIPPAEKTVTVEEILNIPIVVRSGVVENFYGANLIKIRRISPFKFRLGLEKQPEQFNAFPGAIYRWEPGRIGTNYITGLEDKPELRAKLEKVTGYNLSPDSEFYQNLSYKLEEKPKGKLMNLTDPQMGYYNQIVLFAMCKSPLIAETLDDYNSGRKPHAAWYIENKEAEGLRKIDAISREQEAYDAYRSMANTRKVRVSKVLGLEIYGLSEQAAGAELWEYIKGSADNAKRFLDLVAQPDDYILTYAMLNEAIKYNIVRRNSQREFEFRRQPIGSSDTQAVQFLMHHANRMTYLEIDKEIKIKLGLA